MAQHPTVGHFHATPHRGGHAHHPWGFHGPYFHRVALALGARSDEEIQHDVEKTFFWDSWVNPYRVNVLVKDRVVRLTGTVYSPTEKIAAEEDAWSVPGVFKVLNNLRVAR